MPRLEDGTADFGVCIHEGRFTYQQQGLHCVEDLGVRWESETHAPLPLGGILGAKRLGDEVLQKINRCIHRSVLYAHQHRQQAFSTMSRYAQELDAEVIWQHVDLYVNDWTTELGETGEAALHLLAKKAVESKVVGEEIALEIIK